MARMKVGSIESAKCGWGILPTHKPPCATDKVTKMTAAKIDPRTTATRSNLHSIARYQGRLYPPIGARW